MIREALTLDRILAMDPADAAAWFVAREAEGLTPTEEAQRAEWLAADPAHAPALAKAERAWRAFADAEGDEILAAMRAHALAPPARRDGGWRRFAAAAVVLLVAAASLFLFFRPTPGTEQGQMIAYATRQGETRSVVLPDGSRLTLDAASAVTGRFGSGERMLRLERGRALFEVEPDAARPFSVTAGTRRVVAVGTRFEVGLAAGALRVTLLHGRVRVEPANGKGSPILLEPGQQFLERSGTADVRAVETEGDAATGWRRGLIDLDDTPLDEAAAMINRHSRAQIVIRDPRVGGMRISGQFRAGDADRFARTVAEVHPVRPVRNGDRIELAPR